MSLHVYLCVVVGLGKALWSMSVCLCVAVGLEGIVEHVHFYMLFRALAGH